MRIQFTHSFLVIFWAAFRAIGLCAVFATGFAGCASTPSPIQGESSKQPQLASTKAERIQLQGAIDTLYGEIARYEGLIKGSREALRAPARVSAEIKSKLEAQIFSYEAHKISLEARKDELRERLAKLEE